MDKTLSAIVFGASLMVGAADAQPLQKAYFASPNATGVEVSITAAHIMREWSGEFRGYSAKRHKELTFPAQENRVLSSSITHFYTTNHAGVKKIIKIVDTLYSDKKKTTDLVLRENSATVCDSTDEKNPCSHRQLTEADEMVRSTDFSSDMLIRERYDNAMGHGVIHGYFFDVVMNHDFLRQDKIADGLKILVNNHYFFRSSEKIIAISSIRENSRYIEQHDVNIVVMYKEFNENNDCYCVSPSEDHPCSQEQIEEATDLATLCSSYVQE